MSTVNTACRMALVLGAALVLGVLAACGNEEEASRPTDPGVSEDQASPDQGERSLEVELRGCWMSVELIPRPAAVLGSHVPWTGELTGRFYGSTDPLLSVWALACDRGQVDDQVTRDTIVSLVGVATGLTDDQAPPIANHFAHALIRVDTNSPEVDEALSEGGLPVDHDARIAYEHTPSGELPSTGTLDVPRSYRLEVSASTPDPIGEHSHRNRFEYQAGSGRAATLDLSIDGAMDFICFGPTDATCASPRVTAAPDSRLEDLLGAESVPVLIGVDHAKLDRVTLRVHPA